MKTSVLLIEPDKLSARLYKGALSAKGHHVRTAHSSQGALNALDDSRPDVIVLELDIPGHNGLEFLYEFCSYEDWMDIPIIIHTSIPPQRFDKKIVNWAELNVREYIYKVSSNLAELQSVVASFAPALKTNDTV